MQPKAELSKTGSRLSIICSTRGSDASGHFLSNDEVWLKSQTELCDEATALPSILFVLNLEWPLSKVSKAWRVPLGSMLSELFVCVLAEASDGTMAMILKLEKEIDRVFLFETQLKSQISVVELATTRKCHAVQVFLV